MQAPPLVALAGGASSPAWPPPRAAILAAPARLRRGALRFEAKAAWRAAGGGRGPRVPAKGAVLASDMGAEEVVGLDARTEQGLLLPKPPDLTTFINTNPPHSVLFSH